MSSHADSAWGDARWIIGDGNSVRVLDDAWVNAYPLWLWPTMINVEVNLHDWEVSEYITVS